MDHKTKTHKNFTLNIEQFIARFIQHIPDEGFRMIRYYGFLANRVRKKLLPAVYELIGQKEPYTTKAPTYAELIKKNFGFDPLACILCGQQLIFTGVNFGKSNASNLITFHSELALCEIY